MRGIAGVPADTTATQGFMEALKKLPGHQGRQGAFTGWDFGPGGKQALDDPALGHEDRRHLDVGHRLHASSTRSRRPASRASPVVGADNNEFLDQLLDGTPGAAVTNPAIIGGVGAAIAIEALRARTRRATSLTPAGVGHQQNKADVKKYYDPNLAPTYSSQLEVKPYTTYTDDQLKPARVRRPLEMIAERPAAHPRAGRLLAR